MRIAYTAFFVGVEHKTMHFVSASDLGAKQIVSHRSLGISDYKANPFKAYLWRGEYKYMWKAPVGAYVGTLTEKGWR